MRRRLDRTTLTDGYVTISPLEPADAPAHLAGEDELLIRWLNGGPGTKATVDAHIARSVDLWRRGGPVFAFGVRVTGNETLAGTIDVQFQQGFLSDGQANLAYGIYPAWRRQGVASRAVELARLFALDHDAHEAVIRVHPDNAASAAVARRCDFIYTGQSIDHDGSLLNVFVRGLTPATGRVG